MLSLHLIVLLGNLILGSVKCSRDSLLVFELQRHFLHLSTQLHVISMRSNVSFLFLFVAVDPDLASILFSCDLFVLLHDLVEKLLALDVILLLKSLLSDFERISPPLTVSQLFLLVLKLPSIVHHE